MILIELVAAIDAAGTLATFYLSDAHFATSPTDTPPNIAFTQALLDPGSIGLHAYSDGKTTGGATKLETGEIAVINVDGRFDNWLDYGFDGRPVTIRSGAEGRYPDSFQTIFVGTVEGIDATWGQLTIRLRDKQYLFQQPVLLTRYAGTNVLPLGLEGTPNDIQGKSKPRCFGAVFNVPAVQVNTSQLVYQVNDGPVAAIPAVYAEGAALTLGVDFATSALMLVSPPAAGSYNTCLAEGYFQLGLAPAGVVTADVQQGTTDADRTVGQILRSLSMAGGLSFAEVSASDVAALDTINHAVVGIWLDNETTTTQSALDQVAASIGAWYGFDGDGVLRMGVLTEPAGAPALDLYDFDTWEGVERRPARDNGVPAWRVTVNYARNWMPQTSGLVGAVTPDRRAYLALATRSAVAVAPSVKTQHLLATDMVVSGLLVNPADAVAEGNRQLALQKVRRDIFDVPVSINVLTANPLLFMDVVRLTLPRFSLNSGKLFRLIGTRIELASKQAILTLWG